ncbi:DUF5994 family protein [Streptomyces sp. NPDC091217]|uniref:DUF5994 family protein n=1 Tax=Streptomyces sp. NPDC091217 TaxID=3365975 RepID=UPI00382D101F
MNDRVRLSSRWSAAPCGETITCTGRRQRLSGHGLDAAGSATPGPGSPASARAPAWWPRASDLPAELPQLLSGLPRDWRRILGVRVHGTVRTGARGRAAAHHRRPDPLRRARPPRPLPGDNRCGRPEPLRELALTADDPSPAATALEALVRVQGVSTVRPAPDLLTAHSAAPAQHLAEHLLAEAREEAHEPAGGHVELPQSRGPAATMLDPAADPTVVAWR